MRAELKLVVRGEQCETCYGFGIVLIPGCAGAREVTCENCGGKGRVPEGSQVPQEAPHE